MNNRNAVRFAAAALATLATLGSAQAYFLSICDYSGYSSVDLLSDTMGVLGSFSVDDNGNAIATDGTLVFTGHFTFGKVDIFRLDGLQVGGWSRPDIAGNIQGMAYLGSNQLAVMNGGSDSRIHIVKATTGEEISSFAAVSSSTEGISWDGQNLWQVTDDKLYVTDLTGSVQSTIANPAKDSPFQGTGIAVRDTDLVGVVAPNGSWYRIKSDGSSADGGFSGNNALPMYDLTYLRAVPEPSSLVALAAAAAVLVRRRRK